MPRGAALAKIAQNLINLSHGRLYQCEISSESVHNFVSYSVYETQTETERHSDSKPNASIVGDNNKIIFCTCIASEMS